MFPIYTFTSIAMHAAFLENYLIKFSDFVKVRTLMVSKMMKEIRFVNRKSYGCQSFYIFNHESQ